MFYEFSNKICPWLYVFATHSLACFASRWLNTEQLKRHKKVWQSEGASKPITYVYLSGSLMFWTTEQSIEKASLDGNQRDSIVTEDVHWPNGIELDKGNKRIFWLDARHDRVESADYDGNNRKLIFELRDLGPFNGALLPFGMTLIPPFLFFNTQKGVHKLDAITGEVIRSYSINGGRLWGIVAYDYARQPPGI